MFVRSGVTAVTFQGNLLVLRLQTNEATALDTEAQMKDAREALKDEPGTTGAAEPVEMVSVPWQGIFSCTYCLLR